MDLGSFVQSVKCLCVNLESRGSGFEIYGRYCLFYQASLHSFAHVENDTISKSISVLPHCTSIQCQGREMPYTHCQYHNISIFFEIRLVYRDPCGESASYSASVRYVQKGSISHVCTRLIVGSWHRKMHHHAVCTAINWKQLHHNQAVALCQSLGAW